MTPVAPTLDNTTNQEADGILLSRVVFLAFVVPGNFF
jgi:hypothetical protein